jgi:hypothetical protein
VELTVGTVDVVLSVVLDEDEGLTEVVVVGTDVVDVVEDEDDEVVGGAEEVVETAEDEDDDRAEEAATEDVGVRRQRRTQRCSSC